MNEKIERLKIAPIMTIKQAMQLLNKTSKQFLVVVNENDNLLGTITDGDIRRAMINGKSLDTTVNVIMNCNPFICEIGKNEIYYRNVLKDIKRKQLPLLDDNNRLIDIFFRDDVNEQYVNTSKVVLMAGGLGTRLRPLTNEIPKPMLKVGKYPILETILRRFKNQGFNKFIIALNYKKEVIQNYFQDGQMLDIDITYLHEKKRLGTAGALSLIPDRVEEPFIVMNGDLLTNIDFNNLLLKHIESGMAATVCVRRHEYQIPYGVVEVENNRLTSIKEKPICEYLTSAGIYILNPEVMGYIPKNEFYDMPELINKLLVENHSVNVCVIEDYWLDIGQIDDFNKANLEIKDGFYV